MSEASPDMREMFEAVVVDHDRNPVGFGRVEAPTHSASAYNPLCGDRYQVRLRVDDDVVREVGFDGHGCSLSRASMSMMASFAQGRSRSQLVGAAQDLRAALRAADSREAPALDRLGDAAMLVAVRRSPHRVRCALLAWEAAIEALGT